MNPPQTALEKPARKSFGIRLPLPVYADLVVLAAEWDRSLNWVATKAIAEYVERHLDDAVIPPR